MNILICGGGNAAHTLAGLLSATSGQQVKIYLSFKEEVIRWQQGLQHQAGILVRSRDGDLLGKPQVVTDDPAEAAQDVDLVLLALPAFAHEAVLIQLAQYLLPGTWVGALPARGFFDLCARHALGPAIEKMVVFGLQTLPWACRIEQFGQVVRVLGTKAKVDLAAGPTNQAALVTSTLSKLLDLKLCPIDSFLSLTLAGTGQFIHPGIMYGLFHKWDGRPYQQAPLFYQSVDAYTVSVLQNMSDEVMAIRGSLEDLYPDLGLDAVKSLEDWLLRSYGTDIIDTSSLEAAFQTNRSYQGLKAPMVPVNGGFIPDFQARYLSEDVPYGLVPTRAIAELAGIPTPQIDAVLTWAQARLGKVYLVDGQLAGKDLAGSRAPQRYGITQLSQLVALETVSH